MEDCIAYVFFFIFESFSFTSYFYGTVFGEGQESWNLHLLKCCTEVHLSMFALVPFCFSVFQFFWLNLCFSRSSTTNGASESRPYLSDQVLLPHAPESSDFIFKHSFPDLAVEVAVRVALHYFPGVAPPHPRSLHWILFGHWPKRMGKDFACKEGCCLVGHLLLKW